MAVKNYKVGYIAGDGTNCSFKLQSNCVLGHNKYANSPCAMPIIHAVFAKVDEIMAREDSAMKRHGGFKHLRYIRNVDTGTIQFYDIW